MVGLCGQAYASIAVNSSGPLLRGEPTRRSTGHTRGSPSAAGRISGSGFHPAMMRAHSSAWTLLSMPGDRSIAADSSAGEVVVGRPAHVLVLAE